MTTLFYQQAPIHRDAGARLTGVAVPLTSFQSFHIEPEP